METFFIKTKVKTNHSLAEDMTSTNIQAHNYYTKYIKTFYKLIRKTQITQETTRQRT